MSNEVANHYETHLGPIYRWMLGDPDKAMAESQADLDALQLPEGVKGHAIDLGAGLGLHSLALAARGYSVIAVDGYQPFLADLSAAAGNSPIQTVQGDLRRFLADAQQLADIILCLGDTLTHLPDASSVDGLLADAASRLLPGGVFAASFRDYASRELRGHERFISVHSDAHRIVTCFLEYRPTTVMVHDLLHENDGKSWRLRASSYPKLRLSPEHIKRSLQDLGLDARVLSRPRKMPLIVGRRR